MSDVKLNEIPTEDLSHFIIYNLYTGIESQYGWYDDVSEKQFHPTIDEITEFYGRFSLIEETTAPIHRYGDECHRRHIIYRENETGRFWRLQFSEESWESEGAFGDWFEWTQVIPTEKTVTIYEEIK